MERRSGFLEAFFPALHGAMAAEAAFAGHGHRIRCRERRRSVVADAAVGHVGRVGHREAFPLAFRHVVGVVHAVSQFHQARIGRIGRFVADRALVSTQWVAVVDIGWRAGSTVAVLARLVAHEVDARCARRVARDDHEFRVGVRDLEQVARFDRKITGFVGDRDRVGAAAVVGERHIRQCVLGARAVETIGARRGNAIARARADPVEIRCRNTVHLDGELDLKVAPFAAITGVVTVGTPVTAWATLALNSEPSSWQTAPALERLRRSGWARRTRRARRADWAGRAGRAWRACWALRPVLAVVAFATGDADAQRQQRDEWHE